MAKVGLKDTLTLLAKGYTKKDIDALAEIDEQNEVQQEVHAPIITESVPASAVESTPAEGESNQEPDYKSMYEELLEKNKSSEEKLKKLQKENINKDSAPAAAEAKQKETESLLSMVRGFM